MRIYQESNKIDGRQPSTKTYNTNIKLKVSNKRDSFYNNGGTYKSHFPENGAQIDAEKMNAEKQKNADYRNEMRDHHRTALLDHDYKKIYET